MSLSSNVIALATRIGQEIKAVRDERSTVATTGDYSDLVGLPSLGTAAAAATTDFAAAPDTVVECVWTGSAWTAAGGGAVPTDPSKLRSYKSLNDAAATTPTFYNVNDIWHARLS